MKPARNPGPPRWRNASAAFALTPGWLIAIFFFTVTMAWTVAMSFTSSKLLPNWTFVGWKQYEILFASPRALIGARNIMIFGAVFVSGSLILGFLLAIAMDQKVRFENTFRTIFLYALALSFVVTGLVWQWVLNPTLGLQRTVQSWGFESFKLDWLVNADTAIYAICLAGVWHNSGLVMAIMLAGLRGIDRDLWHAAKIDGIKPWRFYLWVVVPELRYMFATAAVLLAIGVIQVYDLVIATTNGGPGTATDVPAVYVMENLFMRQNIGQATAMATLMLLTVLIVAAPFVYIRHFRGMQR